MTRIENARMFKLHEGVKHNLEFILEPHMDISGTEVAARDEYGNLKTEADYYGIKKKTAYIIEVKVNYSKKNKQKAMEQTALFYEYYVKNFEKTFNTEFDKVVLMMAHSEGIKTLRIYNKNIRRGMSEKVYQK